MTGLLIAFAFGVAADQAACRLQGLVGKRAIGADKGLGADATKKMLAELDHTKLLRLRDYVGAELERRKADA